MTSTAELTAQLRASGLRVTAPRLAVLAALSGADDHLTVDEVARRTRAALGSVSTQAVYDVLAALHGAGLARRLEPVGSPARYEARVADNHHHLVCHECGRVVDVDCVVGAAPCLEPADAHGFTVAEAEVTFWGTCPDCRRQPHAADRHQPSDPHRRRAQ
ncbi:MAG: transcriptional repressor [Actinomycetota bacterium]|nr:transcriptional repressor [Actinomycetota bacterium]